MKHLRFSSYLMLSLIGSLVLSTLLPISKLSAARVEYGVEWSTTTGGGSTDVEVDSSGNVYALGNFFTAVDFDPGAATDMRTPVAGGSSYLSKFSSTGAYLWTKTWGGYSKVIKIDSTGSILVSGYFSGTVDFDPGVSTNNITAVINQRPFYSTFNDSGDYVSTTVWQGTNPTLAVNDIVYDSQDNMFVTGSFSGTFDFDTSAGTNSITAPGTNTVDGFVSKYSPAGTYLWTKTWGTSLQDQSFKLSVDSNDNIVVRGQSNSVSLDLDPGAGISPYTGQGGQDIYIIKLNNDGDYIWHKGWGSIGDDYSVASSVDGQGGIYIGCNSDGTFDLDPGAGISTFTSTGDSDICVIKLDSNGEFIWGKYWGGEGYDDIYGFASDSFGNIFVGANTSSISFDYDPGAGTEILTTDGSGTAALSVLDPSGNIVSFSSAYSPGDYSEYVVHETSDGLPYVTGWIEFDPINLTIFGESTSIPASGLGATLILIKPSTTIFNQISSLPGSLVAKEISTGSTASLGSEGVESTSSAEIRLEDSAGKPISQFDVDMSVDRDWSGVTAESSTTSYSSVVSGLAAAPGILGTHSLYVPKGSGHNRVTICPDASVLNEVSVSCSNAVVYEEGDPNVSVTTESGQEYWVIAGLSGTGGISSFVADVQEPTANPTAPGSNSGTGSLASTGTSPVLVQVVGVISILAVASVTLAFSRRKKMYRL